MPVHRGTNEGQPGAQAVQTCKDGVARAREHGYDVVLLDTGGRLHIDEELMQELVDYPNWCPTAGNPVGR